MSLLAMMLPLALACRGAGGGEAPDDASAAEGAPEGAERITLSVSPGTTFGVRLEEELSTRTSRKGDLFTVTTTEPLAAEGRVAVPEGASIRGRVTAVQHSEGAGRPAVLKVSFEEVRVDGRAYPLRASLVEATPETESRTSTAEGAAKVGAGAAAGAIVGRILGGDAEGTIIGAAVGAAAGTAIVLGTQDVDARLPEGSAMTLRLEEPLRVEVTGRVSVR